MRKTYELIDGKKYYPSEGARYQREESARGKIFNRLLAENRAAELIAQKQDVEARIQELTDNFLTTEKEVRAARAVYYEAIGKRKIIQSNLRYWNKELNKRKKGQLKYERNFE